jgi:AmmeMemoRadiSam system protein A
MGLQLVALARAAVRQHLENEARGHAGSPEPLSTEADAPEPASERRAVFVTLRTLDGALRGCVGSLTPLEADVTSETRRSAVLAATRDPRFPPLRPEELGEVLFEVSVLGPPVAVTDPSELDPNRFGVVVRDPRGRRGLLLPGIPGISSAADQVRVARHKAGIADHEPVTIERFEVEKFAEELDLGGRSRI